MADSSFHIEGADLDWQEDGMPVSRRFGDVYFSADDGLAESRHVFLSGCGLPEAWAGKDRFVIGEAGFGTGLNFLAVWELWRREGQGQGRLHFVSVEGYPLNREELTRALSAWPELSELSAALIAAYPEPQPGFHRILLDEGQVTLTLLMGEAAEMLGQLEAQVDAWFLDGFSPSENPQMWRPEVLAEIARLSVPGARMSTFTVAGAVRRGLAEHGFTVEKTPGFARKREMLSARYTGEPQITNSEPWYRPPPSVLPKTVAVVGGGIAGCAIAEAFHRRGVKVTIHERRDDLATEASGNPMGLLMPRLTVKPTPEGTFFTAAFQYALHRLQTLGAAAGFSQCGVLELGRKEKAAIKHKKLEEIMPKSMMRRVDASEASSLSGVPLEQGGMFHSRAGWLRPAAYCKALADGIEVKVGADITSTDDLDADVLVLANGLAAQAWEPAAWLPLGGMRGQISMPKATKDSRHLKCVLTYKGYLTPEADGRHCLGATYGALGDVQTDIRDGDREANFDLLSDVQSGLFSDHKSDDRASVRCVVSDWMPVVGAAPDYQAYLKDFDRLRHGDRRFSYPTATYHQRLYLMTGLGSRGMVSAPLAAELLASQVCGDPWPVAREVATILHPARFILRDLKHQRV